MKLIKKLVQKIKSYFSKPDSKPEVEPVTKQEEPVKPLQSVTRSDIEQLQTAFPVFRYKQGMSHEEIVTGFMKSEGEQKVIAFMASRIQGRIGIGVAHD